MLDPLVPELDPDLDPFSPDAVRRLVSLYGPPLLIVDAERVRRQYRRLAAALPGVDLYYALKPLPQAGVIDTLSRLGAYFDLATNGEVDLVRRLGIEPSRCIHTHPIKRDADIRTARSFGVELFVVDNPDEVRKFVKFKSRARLLIRIAFRSPDAVCDLSRKFGCDPAEAPALLALARELGIRVEGLSFHAGSQASGSAMQVRAIEVCRDLMARAAEDGHRLGILDIGGGFPVDYLEPVIPIEEYCAPIRKALDGVPANVRVIAEPGRFIVAPAAVAVASVMGRSLRDGLWWYYLDDGLYGSYSGQLFDHAHYPIEALVPPGPLHPSVLAGPTCDSIDVIAERIELPKLQVGDLVLGRTMGAYTWATATDFNFFPKPTVIALDRGRRLADRERP
jgi:ornithine decarboxylase